MSRSEFNKPAPEEEAVSSYVFLSMCDTGTNGMVQKTVLNPNMWDITSRKSWSKDAVKLEKATINVPIGSIGRITDTFNQ